MKKVLIGLSVLLLAACSSRMTGATTTVCENVSSTVTDIAQTTVITIEGMDEGILTWTERMTFDRLTYLMTYFSGMDLDGNELEEAYDLIAQTGMRWHFVSLDDDTLVLDFVYNYEELSTRELNFIWDTSDFEREVTLTGAILGLEDQGAVCQTN